MPQNNITTVVNGKRLIDADTLKDIALKRGYSVRIDKYTGRWPCLLVADIANVPTVDAVEVVRCKDCVCYEETCPGYGYCYHWDYEQGMAPNQVESDDFCSYGERRLDR